MEKAKIALIISSVFSMSSVAASFEVNVNSLHYATSINEAEYVRDLIKDEPNLASQLNKEGLTPLHVAIKHSSLTSLAILLEENINPNIKDSNGQTPLMYAVINNHPKAADILLRNGARPEIKDKKGLTAKDYATKDGRKYGYLFEKRSLKNNSEQIASSNDFEKKILKKIEIFNLENKKMLSSFESKLLDLSLEINKIAKEQKEVLEKNNDLNISLIEFKDEIKGTDLTVLDLEQVIEKTSQDASALEKSVISLESKTDFLVRELKRLTEAQMIQMYGKLNTQKEESFDLIGLDKKRSNKKEPDNSSEEELEFLDFGEKTEVKIVEKEDSLNLIK